MNNIDFSKVITPADKLQKEHAEIEAGVDAWLDDTVRRRGYAGIVSCVSYAGDLDPDFSADGTAAKAWRSATYRRLYQLQADPPTGVSTLAEVIALLPQPQDFGWPAQPAESVEEP